MFMISQSQNSSTALHVGDGRLEEPEVDDNGDSRRRVLDIGASVTNGSRSDWVMPETVRRVAATISDVITVIILTVIYFVITNMTEKLSY